MPQSLARILIHLIFSTKQREGLITPQLEPELHRYMGGILSHLDCMPIQIGGISDHVHVLFALGRTITIADLVKELKTGSSQWAKAKGISNFAWQSGYGAFSVGESMVEDVVQYIRNQHEHHCRRTFQDEYRDFLTRYKVAFDERYLWD